MAKVLLADSSVTIQKVVELVLQDKGFEVKAVNSGGEALAALESFNPDMVIADVKLQDINGYELAEKVRSSAATQNVPVLLIAGAFEPVDEELREKSGASDSIIKPFESEDLLEKINVLLGAPAGAEVAMAAEEEVVEVATEMEAEEEEVVEVMAEEEEGEIDESLLSVAEIDEDIEAVEVVEEVAEAGVEVAMVGARELEAEAAGIAMAGGEEVEAEVVEVEMAGEEEVEAEVVEVMAEGEEVEAEMIEEVAPLTVEEAALSPVEEVALPIREAAPQMPASGDMLSIFSEEVSRRLSEIDVKIIDVIKSQLDEIISATSFKDDLLEAITPDVKESVEKVIWKVAPEMTEKIIKETVSGSLVSLKNEMQNIIWETVPDLAESIIKETIEKIRAES